MKQIVVKANSKSQITIKAVITVKDGEIATIKAQKGVNYEFVDTQNLKGPERIITKRVDNDLYISFENERETDLIIQDYYGTADGALVGLGQDGQYYYYIPNTGDIADYVGKLMPGDVEGQVLGGMGFPGPWWAGATATESNVIPWLLGLAGVGAAGVAIANRNDLKSQSQPDSGQSNSELGPKITTINNGKKSGSVIIEPDNSATSTLSTFINEDNKPVVITATKTANV